MKIRPMPDPLGECLGVILLLILLPIVAPAMAIMFTIYWLWRGKQRLLGPRREWQSWFAWHPVHLDAPWGDWVWLEWVKRRCPEPLGDIEYQ